ncbi:hypothetical protein EDI_315750 [Entamoeba dispar SAW760]|uniref:Uncharacterized protein n=1 Tax=Entamoeba dispar (strain ATCC PRA-260 / SAW760) TaxID=370354 RepID=B0EAF8_ENTDS|nr:uncharacterized protein EDI_315750 [Entamoeba dispar SAW760]EDR28471.1 hypothetical protein EDI_315750 [Entamoeba dispar SAW760]|eukprot:EDR28471.1 hypothetical protein EDI_315750 [Entamoeba dispar SAW760]
MQTEETLGNNYTHSEHKIKNSKGKEISLEWKKETGYKRKYQFREKRNYQVAQQSIFLALLNDYFEIELLPPIKRSNVATQLLRINRLVHGEDSILFNLVVEHRCNDLFQKDIENGVPIKTAMRRMETYKISEGLHLLIDLLFELGYIFVSRVTKGAQGSQRIETVKEIWRNGKVILEKSDIEELGTQINSYFFNEIKSQNNCTISKGLNLLMIE